MPESLYIGAPVDHHGRTYFVIDWREEKDGTAVWVCEDSTGRRLTLTDIQLYDDEVFEGLAFS